jgi:hypothetical protein
MKKIFALCALLIPSISAGQEIPDPIQPPPGGAVVSDPLACEFEEDYDGDGKPDAASLTCDAFEACLADGAAWQKSAEQLAEECGPLLGLTPEEALDRASQGKPLKEKKPKSSKKRNGKKPAAPKAPEPKREPKVIMGPPGADGLTSLVVLSDAEDSCPYGGSILITGLDRDRDGELSEEEIVSDALLCGGVPGPQGPKGDRGADGPKGEKGDPGSPGAQFDFGLGVMSSMLVADGKPNAYAIGPSLQLQLGLSSKTALVLEGGWAPGRDRGTMLHASLAHQVLAPWLFVSAGVYAEWIGLTGNMARGQYVGFAKGGGVRFSNGNATLRIELTGFIGATGFDADWEIAFGGAGSATLAFEW